MASSSSDESDGPEEQQYNQPGKYVSAPTAESDDDDDNEADNQSTASSSSEKEPNNPENSEIRAELSTMSFEDLMKLKEQLGAKVYNEAVFGQHRSNNAGRRHPEKKDFKRINKNRPTESGVKRPAPLIGKDKILAAARKDDGPRDPRFDAKCGEFDAAKFKENFSFVGAIKERELEELKKRLGDDDLDDKERKKIKYLIQRMQNQNTEERKRKIREEVRTEERKDIQTAKKELKKPRYVSERERKANELVKQYLDLKNSGKLNKHLEKRRKKNAARDRKKFSFD